MCAMSESSGIFRRNMRRVTRVGRLAPFSGPFVMPVPRLNTPPAVRVKGAWARAGVVNAAPPAPSSRRLRGPFRPPGPARVAARAY